MALVMAAASPLPTTKEAPSSPSTDFASKFHTLRSGGARRNVWPTPDHLRSTSPSRPHFATHAARFLGALRQQIVSDEEMGSAAALSVTRKAPQVMSFLAGGLSQVPMLEGTPAPQLAKLAETMEPCRLQPREVIVRAGEPNDYMYLVHQGQIKLVRPGGGEEIIGPAATFGAEALTHSGPAEYTAVAAGAAGCWRLHRKAFKLLQRDYGSQMRAAVGSIIEQHRASQATSAPSNLSPLQLLVLQAQQRKALAAAQRDGAREFADVPAAVDASSLLDSLGAGNFGDVHLIVHGPTRKLYALKRQHLNGANAREAIDREIACMRAVHSPLIVGFFGEATAEDGTSLMLLEYMGGGCARHTSLLLSSLAHGSLHNLAPYAPFRRDATGSPHSHITHHPHLHVHTAICRTCSRHTRARASTPPPPVSTLAAVSARMTPSIAPTGCTATSSSRTSWSRIMAMRSSSTAASQRCSLMGSTRTRCAARRCALERRLTSKTRAAPPACYHHSTDTHARAAELVNVCVACEYCDVP